MSSKWENILKIIGLIYLSVFIYFGVFNQSILIKIVPEQQVLDEINAKYLGQINDLQNQLAEARKIDPNVQAFNNTIFILGFLAVVVAFVVLFVWYSIKQKEIEAKEKKK
jgi:hypothetical protein